MHQTFACVKSQVLPGIRTNQMELKLKQRLLFIFMNDINFNYKVTVYLGKLNNTKHQQKSNDSLLYDHLVFYLLRHL